MKIKMILLMLICFSASYGQVLRNDSFKFLNKSISTESEIILGNGIVDILTLDSLVWVATGFGLNKTSNAGDTWERFTAGDYKGKGGISAMAFMDDSTFWIASAFDTLTDQGELAAGGGLSYTRDFGITWTHVPQPVDSRDESEYKPTTTVVQNLTFDIAILDSTIWITSFGGGLRKSSDMGQTWKVETTDGIPFSALDYLNHRAFSAMVENGNIWIGTAEGISKSTDGGETWRRFTHQNQNYPISGNFVVALAHQYYIKSPGDTVDNIWAATVEATDTSEVRAVSKSSNDGETWQVMLEGNFAHNFAFDDSIVYVAADEGLFVSNDEGNNWYQLPPLRDNQSGEQILTNTFFSAGVSHDSGISRFWAGSADGLASTIDNGNSWRIYRSYQKPGVGKIADAYAYPNPFSPSRHNFVRFKTFPGEVKIEIYDFAMDKINTIESNAAPPSGVHWDGKNSDGDVVASGVYFFRAKTNDKVTWGKIVVIN